MNGGGCFRPARKLRPFLFEGRGLPGKQPVEANVQGVRDVAQPV